MSDTTTQFVTGWGGARLAVHRVGEGRPVLLFHGLFSSAQVNWIKFGTAQKLADAGFEAIMPDFRAHGDSDAPHEADAYPQGVLTRDALALVEALGLTDFDLAGFSLGARTAAGMAASGLSPRKLVLGGMGLEGLSGWQRRLEFFVGAIDRFDEINRDDPAWFAKSFMQTMKTDRVAARLLLGSIDDFFQDDLAAITMPTLVVCGADDRDNGSARDLAEALPDARYAEVPGTHMSSVTQPDFGTAIADFLKD